MEFGTSIFFTDYSISPADLAMALEERGFDTLWAAEHSHIPVPRRTPAPGGGELAKRYYEVMDPFVTLTAAAAATKRLKVGTGVCLVIQRDTIQTAKLVASIDQVSGGRFLFGIGGGGTPRRSKTTAPNSQRASRRCASRPRRCRRFGRRKRLNTMVTLSTSRR